MIKVDYIDHMGSDLSVVNAARVSFDKGSSWQEPFEDCDPSLLHLSDRDTKLVHYLADHQHMSPFGHCFASFKVKAPVFVARQLVKHKFLRWNEISRRYVDSDPEFYFPEEWRQRPDSSIKQGSGGKAKSQYFPSTYAKEVSELALTDYRKMLQQGVCPEQARMILPQNMLTEWWWSGSLDAFADMCVLRLDEHTQKETQEVAVQIDNKMQQLFPVSWRALVYGA